MESPHQRWSKLIESFQKLAALVLLLAAMSSGQVPVAADADHAPASSVLDYRIEHFEVKNGILRDGIAELISNVGEGLLIGVEEIPRGSIRQDPRTNAVHFSVRLENKTVRDVLNALCDSDPHYTWSADGASINVYPKAEAADRSYFPNLIIDRIVLDAVPDPDQALTPLSKLFPEVQVGYIQMGGENTYAKPWTVTFERVTVRQFVNRIAEHIGAQTSWIWQGDQREKMFTFLRGGMGTPTGSN